MTIRTKHVLLYCSRKHPTDGEKNSTRQNSNTCMSRCRHTRLSVRTLSTFQSCIVMTSLELCSSEKDMCPLKCFRSGIKRWWSKSASVCLVTQLRNNWISKDILVVWIRIKVHWVVRSYNSVSYKWRFVIKLPHHAMDDFKSDQKFIYSVCLSFCWIFRMMSNFKKPKRGWMTLNFYYYFGYYFLSFSFWMMSEIV